MILPMFTFFSFVQNSFLQCHEVSICGMHVYGLSLRLTVLPEALLMYSLLEILPKVLEAKQRIVTHRGIRKIFQKMFSL